MVEKRKLVLSIPRLRVPCTQLDILKDSGWSLRTFFLVLRQSFPGALTGQGRGAVSPPAMASSNVSGGRFAGVWRFSEGATSCVPAETEVHSSRTLQARSELPATAYPIHAAHD